MNNEVAARLRREREQHLLAALENEALTIEDARRALRKKGIEISGSTARNDLRALVARREAAMERVFTAAVRVGVDLFTSPRTPAEAVKEAKARLGRQTNSYHGGNLRKTPEEPVRVR